MEAVIISVEKMESKVSVTVTKCICWQVTRRHVSKVSDKKNHLVVATFVKNP